MFHTKNECLPVQLQRLQTVLLVGSCTSCFIATILGYSFIPDTFTNYAQLSSPLCPMCTQRLLDSSDRKGALSRSSNDTVDLEDVDSISLGILTKL